MNLSQAAAMPTRFGAMLLLTLLTLLPLSGRHAGALEPRPHCESCRRFIDTSPGRCRVTIEGEKMTKSIEACSLFCLYELLEDNRLEGEQRISVLDYASYGSEEQSMMLLRQASCLYEPDLDDELSHEPVVFYFRSEEEARSAQKEHGGTVREYGPVAEDCRELAEEYEEEKGSRYKPLSIRPRARQEQSGD